jgi:hypothetical protein
VPEHRINTSIQDTGVPAVAKKRIPELKIETINDRGNFIYLALIEYKREEYLCVIDSVKPNEIGAYVLDYAEQENIDLAQFFQLTTLWFYSKSDMHPLSVEFAKKGLYSHIVRMINIY